MSPLLGDPSAPSPLWMSCQIAECTAVFRNGSFARGQWEATRTTNACRAMHDDLDGGDKTNGKMSLTWAILCGGK